MFTGIIQDIGEVSAIAKKGDWLITIKVKALSLAHTAIGASISCSGACLTVISKTADSFDVQVSGETLDKTILKNWAVGTAVNLEPALRMGDELGGHLVSGHVDGVARCVLRRNEGDSVRFQFEPTMPDLALELASPELLASEGILTATLPMMPSHTVAVPGSSSVLTLRTDVARFFAPKGSIVIDGVSLTVNEVDGNKLGVNIIPHTQTATTLGQLAEGDTVNFEVDMIARYLDRLVRR